MDWKKLFQETILKPVSKAVSTATRTARKLAEPIKKYVVEPAIPAITQFPRTILGTAFEAERLILPKIIRDEATRRKIELAPNPFISLAQLETLSKPKTAIPEVARQAGAFASLFIPAPIRGAPLLKQVGLGALSGGLFAGTQPNLTTQQRLIQTGIGAGTGGVLAPTTVALSSLAGRGISKILGKKTTQIQPKTPTPQPFLPFPKKAVQPPFIPGRPEVTVGKEGLKFPLRQERISHEAIRQTTEVVGERLQQNPDNPILRDQSKRLFRRIADQFDAGDLNPENIPAILKQHHITPQQFAKEFTDTISTSARDLNSLSRLSRQMNKYLPDEAKLPEPKLGAWDRFVDIYKAVDLPRRGAMVSQWATAARNLISQTGRYTLGTIDDAFQGTFRVAKGEPAGKAFSPFLEDIHAIVRQVTPSGRKRLGEILESNLLEKNKLFGTPVGDIALTNKVVKFMNVLNTSQEYFFRKIGFDSKFTSNLVQAGFDPSNMKAVPGDIFHKAFREATDSALELTFAAQPKYGLGKTVMNMYREAPFLTALGNPFPRFWTNAVKFLFDFSPAGFSKLLTPKTFKSLTSPDSALAAKAVSQATIGTLMWGAGYAIRNSPFAGDKWYEIKMPDGKTLDTRAFAPFSTYMFIGQVLKDPSKLNNFDWADALLSINRIAGTGLTVVDTLRGKGVDDAKKFLAEFSGQYLGGFSVGLRTYSDILAQFRPEAAITRSTKENPVFGPFLSNIPFAAETLPALPRLTREGPYTRENPLLRQLTGLTLKQKNFTESKIDRLGIEMKDLIPRTGDKKIDRLITENTGKIFGQLTPRIQGSRVYQGLDDEGRKQYLKDLFSDVKKDVKAEVLPAIATEIATQWYSELQGKSHGEIRAFLLKQKQKGLLTDDILAELDRLGL